MADEEEGFFSYFPDDFKEYMYKELNWLPKFYETFMAKYLNGVVFWSREDDEPERLSSTLPDGDIFNLNKIIRDLLCTIIQHWIGRPILVQFWAPITTKEGRSFLTTRSQPFSLASLIYDGHDILDIYGLCRYRMICMDSKFDIDLDGGNTCEQHLPARVFKHQFPESTPNVEFYSITEYPQRDDALRCGLRESFAFPVFESSTQRCVGVMEVVTLEEDLGFLICSSNFLICSSYFRNDMYIDFEEFGLKCSVVFDHEDMELDEDENEARIIALVEIENVLKMVCDVHDLPLAQAWVPCKVGWPCRALVDGDILGVSCYYKKDDYGEDVDAFRRISSLFHLKNGVGVVGRALLSTNMIFCRDVTQFSLTEYPLAHYARKAALSGCFAICLESNYTGNDVYVLEFFMPMSNNASEDPHTSLGKILETMRKNFRCLRVASREELGEELHIEDITIQNGEKLDPVQIPQTTISLPLLELSQSEVEVMQVDSSDQQLENAINTGSNVFGTGHNSIAITCTQEKDTVKASKRKGNKSGGTVKASTRKGDKSGGTVKSSDREDNKKGVKIGISLEEILQTSEMKLEDAAQSLGVSKSTLKRVCRGYRIKKWPSRKKNKVVCSQLNESALCVDLGQSSQLNLDDLPSAQLSATTGKTSTRKGDKSGYTVKSSDRKDNKKGVKIEISLEEILQTSEMKLEDAAQSLGVSKSTLKRVCRGYRIKRWPPRKKNKVVCSQLNESAPCVDLEQSSQLYLDDLPSAQPLATIVHTEPHDTTMQDANVVTIKAKYAEGNAIKFRLSLSSRLIELQQEVAQRLDLEAGTYCVKYKDEDGDLILIACDGDLQDYMSVSRSEGKTCIVVLLEPKVPIPDHL
ncbi:protein NLP7-like isoform X2 [Camellia sinensis]|uniref:protein NLP7-like isoform X2 n=1 Tax=Camellia sinensis TaxID=4442 RepID=UPI0010362D2E|nr:protein NLP7-like isoform X2 [Camellia sinensis]